MTKIHLNIDGKEVEGFAGQTILTVAKENGIEIPTLCYDPRLEIFGSCGICVVEAEGSPKLLRACATEIADNMVIHTETARVRESRKTNLELLLTEHSGDCRPPCALACPAQTDCQGYVGLIANGEYEEALKLIKDKIPLPAAIGRVCPHPCEAACRRRLVEESVSILHLKRYAADLDLGKVQPYLPACAPATGKRVTIIGGGPGGLSAAYYLRQQGHEVTVYEAMPRLGGMLYYGIPEYRLPKDVLEREIALIEQLGVTVRLNTKIGRDIPFETLRDQYDAVIIAIGAWQSTALRCSGEELPGVYGGIDFLRKYVANEPLTVGRQVAVVGGGNTAMDACRTAIRLGAEKVCNIYRRTKSEMPAEDSEIQEAEEEGVTFRYLVSPLALEPGDDGRLAQMRLQIMELGEPDSSGRRRPVPVEGKEEILAVDTVIAAIGQGVDPAQLGEVALTKWRTIEADSESFTTNLPGVFAIGDCVNDGASIAIEAIGDAKKAALAVDEYLRGRRVRLVAPYLVKRDDLTAADFENHKKEPRSHLRHLTPAERRDHFGEIVKGFDEEAAVREAARCLECGCLDYFECKLIKMSQDHAVEPTRWREQDPPHLEGADEHPFILRDSNKCVLCGLCVRFCEEVVGATALGFVERGIDTVVQPAFGQPLATSGCISCGQCVSVCPTGALQEKGVGRKAVPLSTTKVASTCPFCSIGCRVEHETVGKLLVKTVPATASTGVDRGLMCGVGRFGPNLVATGERLLTPLRKRDGILQPISWHDSYVQVAKQMESIRVRGGKTAVAIGQHFSYQDASSIQQLAAELDATLFSYQHRANALADAFGFDASPNSLAELANTEFILVVGQTPLENAVVNATLRQAGRRGARIISLDSEDRADRLACAFVNGGENTDFLRQMVKHLLKDNRPVLAGREALQDSLAAVKVSEEAQAVADAYGAAKQALVVFALAELSYEAAAEIANLALLSGHIGRPRRGIVMLRQGAGSQNLAALGLMAGPSAVADSQGLLVFGEDPPAADLAAVEFLAVADSHMTPTAARADLVLPMTALTEAGGSFFNFERRLQEASPLAGPAVPRPRDICRSISAVFARDGAAGDQLDPPTILAVIDPAPIPLPDDAAHLLIYPTAPLKQPSATTNHLMAKIQVILSQLK